VNETHHKAQMSTVLMIDISHSMILYGEDRITPAKKVAMALVELIRSRYPKDTLDILVFGNDAWTIKVKDLPYLQVGPYHTNTVAGIQLALDLLRRKKNTNKQIFMITDVFDVVFQGDPFELMDLDNYDVFAGGEGVDINQEPWNMDNIGKIFPQYRDGCVGVEITNSGIIGGKTQSLLKTYERMFELCEEGSNDHNIKDQAAFNVMISRNEIPRFKRFNLDEGWAMHCAVSGPTEFFVKWGFNNNLKYGVPQMLNDLICTSTGVPFRVGHQFNRVPEWHDIINKKYNIVFEKDVHR
jgi:hypothetical protein